MSEDKSGSLYSMHKLCGELQNESSHSGKTQLIKSFCNVFKGDLYLLAKLMLCKEDKRVFRIKDKAMLKICSHIWDCDLDDMISDLDSGDFTETCKKFYIEYGKYPEKSTLTLKEVDQVLDSLTASGKFDDQVKIINKLLKRCTPFDFRLICRIIDSDLKINTGAKFFLDALHPQAYDAFKKANNLKGVIEKIQQHDFDNNDDDDDDDNDEDDSDSGKNKKKKKSSSSSDGDKKKGKSFEVAIKLMTPVKPMLPKAVKTVEGVIKSSECFYAEIKYDGERIQIHKDGNQFSCYSRNLKPLMPWKVEEVKSYIPKSTKAQQMILDGEILLMDTKTCTPLPFGTLSVHKKNGFVDATVCVFLFDILFINGKSLIHLPLKERREILEKNVSVVKNRIEFSEVTVVNGASEKSKLTALLNRAFKEKLEGLVIKDAMSEYEPGCRHWIKIKKDYIQGMADSADLIAVGGYYGSGSMGGLVTVFLMVCYDKQNKIYKTVVKASGGLDDNAIAKLQPKVMSTMTKISKDVSKIPYWLDCSKQYAPDFIVKDIKQAMIFEIESAEFTKSDHHSTGYSMRFPRIIKIRNDKDYKTATTLEELIDIGKDVKIVPYGKDDKVAKTSSPTTSTTTTTSTTSSKLIKKQLSDDEGDNNNDESNKLKQQESSKLTYVSGDLTDPFSNSGDESNKTFILNYVDNSGNWNEKGLSGAIGKKWPSVPKAFSQGESTIKSGEIRVEKVKCDTTIPSGKKIYVCNVSCIVPPKSKKESYSFSLKDFKSAIKEAKGAINQQKASVHLVKPQFSSPSWSELDELLTKELFNSGIKVFVHSISKSSPIIQSKQKTTTTTTTTTTTSPQLSSSPSESTSSSKISPLKRGRDEKLEHEIIKDIEPSLPIFEDVNAVIDSKTISDIDRKRLVNSIKTMGGRISEKWEQVGVGKTTHLICNGMSDLYLHVDRLGGTIVLPDWVDQCFGSDKLLPLHDDFIYFNKKDHPDYSQSSLLIEEDKVVITSEDTTEGNQQQEDKKVIKESKIIQSKNQSSTTTIDTTITITSTNNNTRKKQHLLSIFQECNIFLHGNVNDRETLKRYIIAYGGDISDSIGENTTHLVASLPNNFSNVKPRDLFKSIVNNNNSCSKNGMIVNSLWLWDSINMSDLLDVKNYKLF
ncbi:hypothetical protein RB653_001411 [Dictyostelium firmibasis]|uniref:DNA ligase n=1 Tax=Dictyostelium firmibasis TaxID=79012 RepID=A0AAN7TWX3_9MYCE